MKFDVSSKSLSSKIRVVKVVYFEKRRRIACRYPGVHMFVIF